MESDVGEGCVLRRLSVDDAHEVATLHVRVWHETYAGLMSAEALAALDVDERAAMWRRWLSDANSPPSWGAFEAETGSLAGWITVGPGRDDDPPVPRELWVLNVAAAHRGSGAARALVEQALGSEPAYLWVVEGNDRAVAFYRKQGFELDGCARPEDDGSTELRMVRGGSSAG